MPREGDWTAIERRTSEDQSRLRTSPALSWSTLWPIPPKKQPPTPLSIPAMWLLAVQLVSAAPKGLCRALLEKRVEAGLLKEGGRGGRGKRRRLVKGGFGHDRAEIGQVPHAPNRNRRRWGAFCTRARRALFKKATDFFAAMAGAGEMRPPSPPPPPNPFNMTLPPNPEQERTTQRASEQVGVPRWVGG